MAQVLELLTSVDTFHDLHIIADSRKAVIKVDRQALHSLLLDHTCMLNELQRHGVKASCPPPPRRRERLKV